MGIGVGLVFVRSAILEWVPVCIAFNEKNLNFRILVGSDVA